MTTTKRDEAGTLRATQRARETVACDVERLMADVVKLAATIESPDDYSHVKDARRKLGEAHDLLLERRKRA